LKILDITAITRKETCIYYRREFVGIASYDLPGRKTDGHIEFTIETTPLGKKDITVKLVDPVDYPVIPIMQTLKAHILSLDTEGKLP
jgi:hypothetical protein